MAVSTTQSIWRSGGGDTTRTAYCGSGLMVASFAIPHTLDDTTPVKAVSTTQVTDSTIVLPAGAVVLNIAVLGGGGATQTFNMGLRTADTAEPTVLLDGVTADAAGVYAIGDAGTGTQIGSATSQMLTVTGGGFASGIVSGYITYFVKDPLAGQQNV